MDDHRGAHAGGSPRCRDPLLGHRCRADNRAGGLRGGHRGRSVPAVVGGRGGRDGRFGLSGDSRTGSGRRSSRVRDRGGAGLGCRFLLRCRIGSGHQRDFAGRRKRHRVQPAAYRSGLVCGHPDLRDQAQARTRLAGRAGAGDHGADGSDSRDAGDLLHAPGPLRSGGRPDRALRRLPLAELDQGGRRARADRRGGGGRWSSSCSLSPPPSYS